MNLKKNDKFLLNGKKYTYMGRIEDDDAYLLKSMENNELVLVTYHILLMEAIKLIGE